MKKLVILIVTIIVSAVAVSLLFLETSSTDITSESTRDNTDSNIVKLNNENVTEVTSKENAVVSTVDSYYKFSNQFYESTDLYPLAIKLLELAQDGNAEAQYLLSEVVRECHPDKLNAIMSVLSKSPLPEYSSLIGWQSSRCAGFNEQNISIFLHKETDGWYRESFKNRYPVSVVEIFSDKYKGKTKDLLLNSLERQQKMELFLDAIKKKNPYALRKLRWLDKASSADAWTLVSCEFGAICSPISINERVAAIATCSVYTKLGKPCDPSAEYREFISVNFDDERIDTLQERTIEILNVLESETVGVEDLKVLFPKGLKSFQ